MYEFVTVYHRKDVKKNPRSRNINDELFWSVQKLLKFLRIYSHPWMVMENRNSILVIFTFENQDIFGKWDIFCNFILTFLFRWFWRWRSFSISSPNFVFEQFEAEPISIVLPLAPLGSRFLLLVTPVDGKYRRKHLKAKALDPHFVHLNNISLMNK